SSRFVTLSPSRSSVSVMLRVSTTRAASIASCTVSPAMKRRAKLVGRRMPYRDASFFSVRLCARLWKKAFDAVSSIQSMRPAGGSQEVSDRARVVPKHGSFPNAEPSAFGDDDPARLEGLGRFVDRLSPAGDAEVRASRRQLVDEAVDP